MLRNAEGDLSTNGDALLEELEKLEQAEVAGNWSEVQKYTSLV